jgi:tripartite-type tricarboxylate transporter receptor subunit TctC
MKVRTVSLLGAAVGAALAVSAPAISARAADFYAGKTINFIIGGEAGGGYDIYGRTIARHLGKHIPGNPNVVPSNMPGAGSARAAGYINAVAPKDGTVIAAIYPGAVIGPLLDDRTKWEFDPAKLTYLGTIDMGTRVCFTFASTKIKSFDDLLQKDIALGGSAVGGPSHDYAAIVKNTTDARVKLVKGYKGTRDIVLAMERGEVDGICGWEWASLKAQHPDFIRDGKINLLAQIGPEPDPDLAKQGIPELWKYIKNEKDRAAVELIVAQQAFGRPYIAPPGTPADRVEILRDAFEAVFKDPAFLADAEKQQLDLALSPGGKVQEIVKRAFATPPDIVQRARDIITK